MSTDDEPERDPRPQRDPQGDSRLSPEPLHHRDDGDPPARLHRPADRHLLRPSRRLSRAPRWTNASGSPSCTCSSSRSSCPPPSPPTPSSANANKEPSNRYYEVGERRATDVLPSDPCRAEYHRRVSSRPLPHRACGSPAHGVPPGSRWLAFRRANGVGETSKRSRSQTAATNDRRRLGTEVPPPSRR